MRFSTVAATLAAVATASAQTPMTYNVKVGAGGLQYVPNQISGVNVGDTIAFTFVAKDHSVTQSSFVSPCSNLSSDPTKFLDSGFFPVAANATELPQWSFTVTNATAPLWFYCRQVGHCSKGMVFAINPTAAHSFQAYQQTANSTTATTDTNGLPLTAAATAGGNAAAAGSPAAASSVAATGTNTGTAATTSPSSGANALTVGAAGLMGVAGVMSLLL